MKSRLFPRTILPEIRKELKSQKIVILTGSRRVGKTSILKILQNELQKIDIPQATLDLDLEANINALSSLDHFLDYLRQEGIDPKKKAVIFIDEFQHAEKSTLIFKNLYDHYPVLKIIASGSSSLTIKKIMQESLAGRKRTFHIFPLSFREMLNFQGEHDLLKSITNIKKVNFPKIDVVFKLNKKFDEYLIFGGYPDVVLAKTYVQKIKELQDIHESYIKKDVRSFLHIKNVQAYNRLIEYLAVNNGQLLNISQLTREIGVHRLTLENYLQLLEDTFIIIPVRPFFANRNKEILKSPKIYFEDMGLRNYLITSFQTDLAKRTDTGSLLENAVLAELQKSQTLLQKIYFWRTKSGQEVDFVMQKGSQLIPIEVKRTIHPTISDSKNLQTFLKLYLKAKKGVLLSNKKDKKRGDIEYHFFWDKP